MTYPIEIKTREDVIKLNKEATKSDIKLSISTGTTILDPRSILCLFALIGKKVNLVAPDHSDPNNFLRLIKRMGVSA